MKTIIIYGGKTGTTERCAKILGQRLDDVTLVNIDKSDIDLSNYDLIIIGSSIRVGTFHSKIKKFIKKNSELLKNKRVAYYICCGFIDDSKEYFEKNISSNLLKSAIAVSSFGGELDISKQKGIDKLIVSIVKKTEKGKREVRILEENIDSFVKKIIQ